MSRIPVKVTPNARRTELIEEADRDPVAGVAP
jgi:hypothetical protein